MPKKPTAAAKKPAPPPAPERPPRPVKPPPPPARLFLVRCTFFGEAKTGKVEGSFRFIAQAPDTAGLSIKVEKAVKRLRRMNEIPSKCQVYVEFVLELGGLDQGIVADFERWEKEPRRFQHGCIAFSDVCALHQTGGAEPAFRFGPSAEPPSAPVSQPA